MYDRLVLFRQTSGCRMRPFPHGCRCSAHGRRTQPFDQLDLPNQSKDGEIDKDAHGRPARDRLAPGLHASLRHTLRAIKKTKYTLEEVRASLILPVQIKDDEGVRINTYLTP